MARVDGIINRVAKVLARLNACDRPAFKRVITRTGGDPLTGRGASVSNDDTLLDPQPSVAPTSSANTLALQIDTTSGQTGTTYLAQEGLKYFTVSALAVSRLELQDPTMAIVFKDDLNHEEVLYVVAYSSQSFQGKDIAFDIALSSKKR